MLFWAITAGVCLAALSLLVRAVWRAKVQAEPPAAYDLRVYRDQLKEIDRDVARGVLDAQDAERVRVEVSRRILAADAALQGAQDQKTGGAAGWGILAAVGVVSGAGIFALYLSLGAPGYGDLALADRIETAERLRAERPGQQAAEAGVTPPAPEDSAENAEYLTLVGQLRSALAERPDDERGHRLLAQAEARLGQFQAAYRAQARVIELTGGAQADIADWTNYADLLILAAGGYISPEAEDVLEGILRRDPANGVARYYWSLMHAQIGRPDIAFRGWDALLREGPREAPWIDLILQQIDEVAARAGVQYQIPVIGTGIGVGRGPTAADIDAAEDLSPTERLEMIQSMVSGLSTRLANEGGPPQDWAQLITSLSVLGRIADADLVFRNAQEAWGNDPGAMDIINRAADRAGLL